MTQRTVSVFRFQGYELQSNFPIGSKEFDNDFNMLCNGYMKIPGSEIIVQSEAPFGSVNANGILNNEAGVTGYVPVTILWIEKIDPDTLINQGKNVVYPKVFHKASGFLGRTLVEEKKLNSL